VIGIGTDFTACTMDRRPRCRELTDFATMVGTELLVIDENTTHRAFANELRWNQPYYRLGPAF
jgi:L-arabinose isomerase